MKKALALLLSIIMIMPMLAIPVFAAEEFAIAQNGIGELVLEGTTSANRNVSLVVYEGEMKKETIQYLGQTKSDAAGNISLKFDMPESAATGKYNAVIQRVGGSATEKEFTYSKETMEILPLGAKMSVKGKMAPNKKFSFVVYEGTVSIENVKYMNQFISDKSGSYNVIFELPDECDGKELTFSLQPINGEVLTKTYTYKKPTRSDVWWHSISKMVNDSPVELGADAQIGSSMGWNAGAGLYYTAHEISSASWNSMKKTLEDNGVRRIGWIEGAGDTRVMAGGLKKLDDGTYQLNPNTGAANLIANPWNWASNSKNANEYVWLSAAEMVNGFDYQGEYVWPEDAPLPTYPDGTSALGYINDDRTDPRNAKLYDAMAQKDIYGNLFISEPTTLAETDADSFKINCGEYSTRNFYFSKDMASPWWIEYNRYAVRQLLEDGIDGFWIDNYNGWNYCYGWTTQCGFGDWSVALFRDYLKKHPEVGISDTDNFDIRTYLLDNSGNYSWWGDLNWSNDSVWTAYKAFKADILSQRMAELYAMIKEEAARAGRNPDDILVMGNDISKYAFGGERGTYLDMVSTEYTPNANSAWNYENPDRVAPIGYSAVQYKVSASMGAVNRAHIWQYRSPEYDSEAMALVNGYEALANNTTLYLGTQSGTKTYYGNGNSTRKIFATIDAVKDLFSERESAARTAILYSPQSEAFSVVPTVAAIEHRQEMNGWAYAMEDAKIPYMIIPDYKLDKERLKDVKLLILPDVLSISDKLINDTIIPYIQAGGKLIVTGENAGLYKTSAEVWAKRAKAALAELAATYPENVIYSSEKVGITYFNTDDRKDIGIYLAEGNTVEIAPGISVKKPNFDYANDKVAASISVTNNNTQKFVADAFVASYSNGKLIGINKKEVSVDSGASANLIFDKIPSGTNEKIYFWGENLNPVSDTLNVKVYNKNSKIGALMAQAASEFEITESGFGDRVILATHKDKNAKRYYVDLVNRDIDSAAGVITASNGGKVKIKLPYEYKNPVCVMTNSEDNIPTQIKLNLLGNNCVSVTVPEFNNYVSLAFYDAGK